VLQPKQQLNPFRCTFEVLQWSKRCNQTNLQQTLEPTPAKHGPDDLYLHDRAIVGMTRDFGVATEIPEVGGDAGKMGVGRVKK